MSKTAYVFVFLVIGLALLLHALDERSDREVIGKAASIALHDGVMTACENRNRIRTGAVSLTQGLHPESRVNEIRGDMGYENCDALALQSVKDFQRKLSNKT